MLDLLCSCSDNFAAIEHLGIIYVVSGGLYVLVLVSAIYIQYVMAEANERFAYAPVVSNTPPSHLFEDVDECWHRSRDTQRGQGRVRRDMPKGLAI